MLANLHQIANAVGIQIQSLPKTIINNVVSNSQQVQSGDLFIAIIGQNFDGHCYIDEALKNGAAALIVSKPQPDCSVPALLVENTKYAFGQIGAWARRYYNPTVFAITGSNGKTSVKNMLAAIMQCHGETLATQGNLNNDIGVPMTLCCLREKHRYLVIELGSNHVGEIKYLTQLVMPDVALVNNAGDAHLGEFGSLENLVQEKGEIYQGLSSSGIAIINNQSPHQNFWLKQLTTKNIIDFGQNGSVLASHIKHHKNGYTFTLCFNNTTQPISLNFLGKHHIDNALAASSCALAIGVSMACIRQGLSQAKPEKGRLKLHKLRYFKVIDDSYNANPNSMKAAIDTLKECDGQKVLVLGEMAELGNSSQQKHKEVFAYAQSAGIHYIYSLGEPARVYGANHFNNIEHLSKQLFNNHQHSTILIKGSRLAKMERVLHILQVKN